MSLENDGARCLQYESDLRITQQYGKIFFFFFLSFVIFKRIHISIVVQAKHELENDDSDTTQYGSLVLGKSL